MGANGELTGEGIFLPLPHYQGFSAFTYGPWSMNRVFIYEWIEPEGTHVVTVKLTFWRSQNKKTRGLVRIRRVLVYTFFEDKPASEPGNNFPDIDDELWKIAFLFHLTLRV